MEEAIKKIEEYLTFTENEYQHAKEKDLVMIAYDMHSRGVACRHLLGFLTGRTPPQGEYYKKGYFKD